MTNRSSEFGVRSAEFEKTIPHSLPASHRSGQAGAFRIPHLR